jgi:hypothetical protein
MLEACCTTSIWSESGKVQPQAPIWGNEIALARHPVTVVGGLLNKIKDESHGMTPQAMSEAMRHFAFRVRLRRWLVSSPSCANLIVRP